MDFMDYQKAALRTASLGEGNVEIINAALGLAGEAGEVADMVKKAVFQGHDLDEAAIMGEVGDVLWYCALAAHAIGVELEDIAKSNIAKLQKRYPDGFSVEKSVHRVE